MIKTAFITGASRGIGFALSKCFIENGYKVIGTSRTGEIPNISHNNFEVMKLDLSDMASIKELSQLVDQQKLKIDILINNAGIGPDLDYTKPEEKTFERTFEVNVTGTVFFTEALSRNIIKAGKIINISSKMGSIKLCTQTDSVAYRMSKTALNMYTKILTNRLLGQQTVASVHPGWVRTTIAKSNVHGRLTAKESALKIFEFILSDFETGIFWNVETISKMEW